MLEMAFDTAYGILNDEEGVPWMLARRGKVFFLVACGLSALLLIFGVWYAIKMFPPGQPWIKRNLVVLDALTIK